MLKNIRFKPCFADVIPDETEPFDNRKLGDLSIK
jgi:hypothetical protein